MLQNAPYIWDILHGYVMNGVTNGIFVTNGMAFKRACHENPRNKNQLKQIKTKTNRNLHKKNLCFLVCFGFYLFLKGYG